MKTIKKKKKNTTAWKHLFDSFPTNRTTLGLKKPLYIKDVAISGKNPRTKSLPPSHPRRSRLSGQRVSHGRFIPVTNKACNQQQPTEREHSLTLSFSGEPESRRGRQKTIFTGFLTASEQPTCVLASFVHIIIINNCRKINMLRKVMN